MLSPKSFAVSLGLAYLNFFSVARGATLTVSTTGGNTSSPILYGLMFEDINNSGDGGIHGQLLQNNGFQGTDPGLTAYAAVGDVTLAQDTSTPLSTAITSSLKVTVPKGATGQVGFSNSGWLGVPVNDDTYTSYFWMQGTYSGTVTIELVGVVDGIVYASSSITVDSIDSTFTEYETTFTSAQAPTGNNTWQLTFDASLVAGSSLWFDLVQLFPTTYFDRYNGLRADVADFIADIGASFLRFPGGNNVMGETPADRWKWNETIGPLQDRPGRQGDWGYPNTDELGLMEYLQWTIDMDLTPVLAIWSGLSLGGTIVSGSDLDPYVDDALNELEFLLGSTDTPYGALRASYGQEDPYVISYVEIGNEDNLNGGCDSYVTRFSQFYDAIHAAYPDITVIASTTDSSCLPSPLPEGVVTDIHFYESPSTFISMFNLWDNYPRTNGILCGEYANTATDDGVGIYWSTVQGATSEAVYMIGMERNSDLIRGASYAPMFEHFNLAEWSPDLAGVDSDPGSITGSVSYYVQLLFSKARGSTILPVTTTTDFDPLYWVASTTDTGTYYVKLANYGTVDETVTVEIPDAKGLSDTATLEVLTGPATTSNYPLDVTILPTTTTVTGSATGGWTFTVPGYGVAVLTVTS